MRFAFAGFDRWRGVFDAFVKAGWEPVAMFTIPVDNVIDFNDEIVARAELHRLPLKMSPLREDDLRALRELQCDVLVVAGYSWKIPDWSAYLPHAVNFHPSPLPDGRGPYPPIQALLEDRSEWGVSCHRLAAEFDTGHVLAAEHFAMTDDECHETLQLKLQMATRTLAARVASSFHRLWEESRPQTQGSYWPRIDDARRTLDFNQPVADVMRVVRACGLFECFAPLRNAKVSVKRAHGWREAHDYTPGEIVHEYRRWVVIAVRDGFVALIEWSPLPLTLRRQMGP
ncbi:formyltransferase family protein [Paraburkholderia sediminicola]|uniref:methionyl-tRNA formyltransferase n=1 Tax=Paraburkholderia sediminicola TaxID=458836 RepID=UPI0038B8A9D6